MQPSMLLDGVLEGEVGGSHFVRRRRTPHIVAVVRRSRSCPWSAPEYCPTK